MAVDPNDEQAGASEEREGKRRAAPRAGSPGVFISLSYAALATLWILFSDHALAFFVSTPERMVDWSVGKGLGFVVVTTGFLFLRLRKTYGALESTNLRLRGREKDLERLGRLNAALSHINQAIVRLPVREELFRRVCEVLVEQGGFRLAWIGWRDPATGRLVPVAVKGEGEEYVLGMRVPADGRPEGCGFAERSFRSGASQICNEVLSEAELLPWREEMRRLGIRSAVALPIREGGRVDGVLLAYSDEPGFFRPGELALFQEATGDIAFALDNLAREEERRRAEAEAEAERRFSDTMIDSMPGVLYFYDENRRFLRWNRNFVRVTGYSDEEIARLSPLDFFEPRFRPLVDARIAEVFARGESSVEAPFRAKDGRSIPYFFTGRRVEFNGRPCLVGAGIDISERERAEEALRESEELFRATFEQAAVGIAHVTPEGRFRWVNDRLCAITGYSRDELAGLTFGELTVGEEREEGERRREALLAGERKAFTIEKRYRRKDGEAVWVNVVTTLLRDAEGAPKYFVAVIVDISERKRLEQQFLRAQRLESIGTLAGGIAHDLNNLLAPIMMGVELLRLHSLPPPTAPVLDNMERSARRAASLVRQVLSFARGVEGARTLLDLREVAREVEAFVKSSFPRNIAWRCELAPDLWPVTGDTTQLHQVLLNLCVNARDALPDGGRLTLRDANVVLDSAKADEGRGETPGRHVLLEVADDGCGMSPAVRERIFEPFFTTKSPGKGTGLGLSTALGIVRSHGGRMEVDSAPGQGTTFRIFLPARAEETSDGAARQSAERPRLGEGELVLVVDDESSLLEVTRQMLAAFGYRVLVASDGAEALAIFERRRAEIAAVIADMRMPGMDGPGLVGALRKIDPETPLIGVGGAADGDNTPEGEALPAFYLPKPYGADLLLAVLRRALATSRPRKPGSRGS